MSTSWTEHAIWWQVYPLGFVGAFPGAQPPEPGEHRLRRLVDWLDHAIELGASGIALGPIFASRTHGYDTTDHYRIDPRLGDDADFDRLIAEARTVVACASCSTGCSTTSALDFARYRDAQHRDASARWFRGPARPVRHLRRATASSSRSTTSSPAVVDYAVDVMSHWLRTRR